MKWYAKRKLAWMLWLMNRFTRCGTLFWIFSVKFLSITATIVTITNTKT